jgi:hypothetical protein
LKTVRVNFLAIDLDRTILEIHTGGRWKEPAEAIFPHIRPIFRSLIPAARREGLYVAVVTFSNQIEIVHQILEHIGTPDVPIRGGYPGLDFVYEGQGSTQGKQAHMASVVEELQARHKGLEITRASTVLIDDDVKNIRVALQNGVRAVWLNPKQSDRLLNDLHELV